MEQDSKKHRHHIINIEALDSDDEENKSDKRETSTISNTSNISERQSLNTGNDVNGWNGFNTKMAIRWMLRCASLSKKMFDKMKKMDRIWKVLLILQVLVTGTFTALTLVNLGTKEDIYENFGISIDAALTFFGFVATILSGVIATFKFAEVVESLRTSITKFSKLIRTIEKVVNTNRDKRPDADTFLDQVSEKYHKYYSSAGMLVKEMSNYKHIKERINSAASRNNIRPFSLKDVISGDEDDEEVTDMLKPLGLIGRKKKTNITSTPLSHFLNTQQKHPTPQITKTPELTPTVGTSTTSSDLEMQDQQGQQQKETIREKIKDHDFTQGEWVEK